MTHGATANEAGVAKRATVPSCLARLVAEELAGSGITAPQAAAYRVTASEDRGLDRLVIDFELGPDAVLPIEFRGWALHDDNADKVARKAAARIREAWQRRQRLLDPLHTARLQIERAAPRVGGDVRFVSLGFAPLDGEQAVNLRYLSFALVHECLDHELKVVRKTLDGSRARTILGYLRADAPRQRRLARQRVRLASAGALFEIDAMAQAAIEASGHAHEDVFARAAAGENLIRLSGEWTEGGDTRMSVALEDGWLRAYGYLTPAPMRTFTQLGRLRIDEPMPAEHRRALVGRPATALFDHPVLRAAGRILGVEDHNGHLTDVKLSRGPSRLVYAADLPPATHAEPSA